MKSEMSELTEKELEIVRKYFEGSPIRQLALEYKGFGRTKINNILKRYVKEHPEDAKKLEESKIKAKTHKKNIDGYSTEFTDEDVAKAYEAIKSGKTLTEVARKYGRTRDFIKNQILDYIDDQNEIEEFLEQLEANQHPKSNASFLQVSEEEKKQMIFERLNARRVRNKRRPYPENLLERKYNRLKEYFLVTRNQKCKEVLTENDFYKMLYDTPTLLSSSFSSKIVPAMNNLDDNPDIGIENATHIIREDASILCSAIDRTNLQIKILSSEGLLESFIRKPRNFRTSPELMYALIQFKMNRANTQVDAEDLSINGYDDIFITKNRLLERYGFTPEILMKRFDIKKEYGDDEYFDK